MDMKNTIILTMLAAFLVSCVEGRPEDNLLGEAPDVAPGPKPLEPGEVKCQQEHTVTRVGDGYKQATTTSYALIDGISIDSNYCVKSTYSEGYINSGCRPIETGCTETGVSASASTYYNCRSGSFNNAGQLILSCGSKTVITQNGVATTSGYTVQNILYR